MHTILLLLTLAEVSAGIPKGLLVAVCSAESDLDPNSVNMNDGGYSNHSLGLCQVSYRTARELGLPEDKNCTSSNVTKLKECSLLDIRTNIKYASMYLSKQLSRYKGNTTKAISAYNAGSFSTKNTKYVTRVKGRWK